MSWVDWAIVLVMVVSAIGGLEQGFFRAAFGLGGLFLGLVLAAWNYAHAAAFLMPVLRFEPLADTVAFLLIAVLVMTLASLAGTLLAKAIHGIGLGCLDRLAGGLFGLFQGAMLVMLCVLVAVAFFPQARWLTEARLPRRFFVACHISTHMSPQALAQRVRQSLERLEQESPAWLHPRGTGS